MQMKKVALVTGGSRGLGRDMALRLAENHFNVILTYRDQEAMALQVVAEIEARGQQAAALALDLAFSSGLQYFVEKLTATLNQKFGSASLHALVNNAGMGATIPFAEATEEQFDQFLNVHFKSVFLLTRLCLPLFAEGASIVNISTGTTRFCIPGYSMYASMKGAIEIFTKYLAKELGSRGIRANVVAPGPIETDFNQAAIRSNPQLKGFLSGLSPLGRVGNAEDIGGVVAFLCSDDARWITGQRLEVSGGINI